MLDDFEEELGNRPVLDFRLPGNKDNSDIGHLNNLYLGGKGTRV